ncbi:hypothetical protein EAI_02847 [Harpegnathos saltator]|uniref:Uncharacterized protein n=1 Tax=Harpegnathos saltator TaxID=610380 RepID=E2C6R2_HARSA|nr:hypothetical protein EAI_02847 [Harpegnathos saltator]
MDGTRVNEKVAFALDRMTIGMERNSEEYRGEPRKNESENESNDEDYARSPVLLDLDENSKQQQKAARREASSPNATLTMQDQRLQDQLTPSTSDDTTGTSMTRPQSLRDGRWQETSYEPASRQQNPEAVLVIRVPEPEIIGSHSHLEMLHETNIKSVQQESSQTEKGAAISNCASPGEIILDSTNLSILVEESRVTRFDRDPQIFVTRPLYLSQQDRRRRLLSVPPLS